MSHFSWFQGHYIVIEGSNHQAGLWNYGPRGCVFLDHPLGATPVDEESELCRLKERCAYIYIYISHIRLVAGLEHEFYVSIYWEQSSQLTNMFQRGWNHQPVYKPYLCRFKSGWSRTSPTKKSASFGLRRWSAIRRAWRKPTSSPMPFLSSLGVFFWGYLTVCHGRWSFLTRKSSNKTSLNGQFSMAMSNNQKVEGVAPCWAWTGCTFSGFIYLFEGVIFC